MENRQILTDDDVFGAPAPTRLTDDDVFGPAKTMLTDDDVFGPEEGGVMDYVGNIARGVGERAAKLGGGLVRGVATAVEPVGDWLQRNVGDFVREADGSITFRRLTAGEAAQPSGVLTTGQSAAGALEKADLGYAAGTTWEDFKSSPIKKFIPFAIEQGLVSTPDMIAALTNLPAYIAARTGEMGQERAKNNSLDNATVEDLLTVMPGAVASSMLERIGAAGIFKDVAVQSAKQLPGAVLRAGAREGLTEAGQELIEYGSTNIGTEAGFDPATAGERMAAGAVGGAGFGGIARAATAGVESSVGRSPAADAQATNSEPEPDGYYRTEEQTAPPANADSADILFGGDPETTQPSTPERIEAVQRMAPVDPERVDSPRLTPEDRASPLPNDLIDDGKAVIEAAIAGEAVANPQAPAPAQTAVDVGQTTNAPAAESITNEEMLLPTTVTPAPQTSAQPAPRRAAPRQTPDGFPADRFGNVKKPKSIIEFLAERGGIRDPKGDLAAMGLKGGKDSFIAGAGSLIRKGGMTLDYARKLAVEAGYLTDTSGDGPSQSTVTDLLDAIDQDARSGRTLFSQDDANQAIRWQEERQAQQDLDQYGSEQEFRLQAALDEVVSLTGSDRADPVAIDIATMMAQDDVDFDTAAIEVERRIDQKLSGTGREYRFEPPPSLKDIPFFGDETAFTARIEDGQFPGDAAVDSGAVYENRTRGPSAGNPVQGPRAERGLEGAGRTGDGSGTVQADDGRGQPEARNSEVTAEPVTDGKPQPATKKAGLSSVPPLSAEALLKTVTTAVPAERAEDGRAYRIKKDAEDGFIGMRMPASPGEMPTYFRPPLGQTWTKDEAAAYTIAQVGKEGGGGRATADGDVRSPQIFDQPAPKVEAEPDQEPAAKIDDFGEKIAGARKDMVREFKAVLEADVDIENEPLSKIFPQPDYEKLAESGADRRALAMIALARNEIPSKPRKGYKVPRWVAQVKTMRDFAANLVAGKFDSEEARRRMLMTSGLSNLANTAEIISDVPPAKLAEASKWRVRSGSYTMFDGVKYDKPQLLYTLDDDKGRMVKDANGKTIATETVQELREATASIVKERLSGEKPTEKRRTPVNVYSNRGDKTFFIGFKGLSGVIRLKGGFEKIRDARSYITDNADAIQDQIDEMRTGVQMRRDVNRPREGVDRREGDVTPEQFQEAFGFRGVQFGNYVEDARRQFDLNEAFDGLMDLAEVLGLPPKALSLNGTLGLAFGARGKGGLNSAKAHFEPDQIAINLTKAKGAGSLAHEWFHGLDNYFGRMDTGGKMSAMISTDKKRAGGTRDEIWSAWKAVAGSLDSGSYAQRMAKYDEARSTPYWNTMVEKVARGFEKYVVDRLADKKASNDYLANIDENAGAYPTDKEMAEQGVTAALDNLFATIETTADGGNVKMFSRRREVEQTPAFKQWFGDSKVVDADGKPLVVYRGEESIFAEDQGVWFTSDAETASAYAEAVAGGFAEGANITPAYMAIKRPLEVDARGARYDAIPYKGGTATTDELAVEALNGRYDGLIVRNVFDGSTKPVDVFRPVNASQIKSINNRGTFNPTDARIMFQRADGLTDQFTGDIDAVTADLRQRLDKLGLSDVAIRMSPVIEGYADGKRFAADGSYFRGLIEVSLSSPDKTATLNHEAIHALKNLNVFNKTEWTILSAKSKSDWINRYGITEAYEGSSQEVQIEEGVASAYADWAAGKRASGTFSRLFQRIKDVISSLGNALRGRGFDSIGAIFERVEGGDVGSRGLFRDGPDASGDKRFALVSDPTTMEEKQQVMQGFIARGQPIDRAIRLPFEIFGGINKNGTWNPAQKVNDKLSSSGRLGLGFGGVIGAGIGGVAGGPIGAAIGGTVGATAGVALLRANINPTGKFGWLYPFAENARRGLIDRYGLSDEYVEADKARQTAQRGIMQKAQDILQVLQNASVGPAEAKVLQAILTGENVTDTEMAKVAAPIRKTIDELGAEAVSLGLISAESFERNRGAYLHRVYQKNEMDQGGVASWAAKFMAKKRVKIMGDQLKGRGLFWDVPVERLMADVPGWTEGQKGTPSNGDKFKVLDYVPGTSTDMLSGESKDLSTKRRAYLPADKPLPKKFQGPEWQDRGTWEVRGTGKKVTIWRDYTKDERMKMGEILDARYTIAKTFMLMANDLSTGRFYKQVAENEQWAQKQPPATEWREAADYGRFWNDPSVGWVKVPETTIANSGGKKRYGALSGMFVRAEIWRDLNEVDQMQKSNIWKQVLTQWKKNKTARSPVTHMNNIMSNMMFMDLADVRMQDLVSGIRSFVKEDKNYIEARDAGAFGSDMIAQEIRKEVLQPILDEISKTEAGGKNPLLARMGAVGTVADKIWTWAKAADDRMMQAYQMEDEVFRMATYLRRRSLGDSAEVAAKNAREQFLDYDIRAPWVNAARNSVLPFISYSYRAIPKIAENISNRPWKLAKYFALAYAANALAYMWDDGEDGEDRERASLRSEEQGYTWLGVPRMLRMPYRDANGMPVFLDVRRWVPAGDVFDTNQGQSAVPVPAPLQLGGPLMLAFEFALNKQAFTGNEITNDLTDTAGDKTAKVSDWLWKSWMPSAVWVPNSWYWEKVSNAIKGAEDSSGRRYPLTEAVTSSFGVKLKPQNVSEGLEWRGREMRAVERALRDEMRRLSRHRERNLISQPQFDKSAAQIMEKFANLQAKADDLGRRSQPKGQRDRSSESQ